jgi:hypothetical protein
MSQFKYSSSKIEKTEEEYVVTGKGDFCKSLDCEAVRKEDFTRFLKSRLISDSCGE